MFPTGDTAKGIRTAVKPRSVQFPSSWSFYQVNLPPKELDYNQEMLTTTTTIKNMIVKAKKSVLTKSGKRV